MKDSQEPIVLTIDELRVLAGFAAACAAKALPIFERHVPDDTRPRDAIQAALDFSRTGKRSNALRMSGLAAYRASRGIAVPAAAEAALAATQAVGAAYLHPLASPLQVKHILGAAAHAARAQELEADDAQAVGKAQCDWAVQHMPSAARAVLARYPAAPAKGGRTGALLRYLDDALRP